MTKTRFDRSRSRRIRQSGEKLPEVDGIAAPVKRVVPIIAPLVRLLTDSPNPLFITDPRNRIVLWNAAAERMLGYTAEEAIGASCVALLHGCDLHENHYCSENCPINQMAAHDRVIRPFVLRFRASDSSTVSVDVSILHLAMNAPGDFLLVHILNPLPPLMPEAREEISPPPRSVQEAARASVDSRIRTLTPREVEVLAMLAAGQSTPGIAAALHISASTARNHTQNILKKLEVHSKAEAVSYAFKRQLFEIPVL